MTTMPSAMLIVWLMPVTIDGTACGSCTLVSTWRRDDPNIRAASTVSLGDLPDSEVGESHDRRERIDECGDGRWDLPDAEQQHRWHEVRGRRNGLHGVEDRSHEAVAAIAQRRPDAERYTDHDRQPDRHDHQRHRLHRRLPQPDDAGERHAPGGERGRSPAPGPGDQREHDDGQREPRQPEKEVGERVECGVDAVPERLEEPREQRVREAVVLDPVLQLVDRIGEAEVQAVGEPVDESVE